MIDDALICEKRHVEYSLIVDNVSGVMLAETTYDPPRFVPLIRTPLSKLD